MNYDVRAHLRSARERLKDAEGMLSLARYAGAVNRTYWTMFEVACAMLASRGVKVRSHEGAKIRFGELFVMTGEVGPEFGRALSDALSFGKMPTMRSTLEPKYPARSPKKSFERPQNF
jgi:uncharacterized protein (UPF0332 family)